MGVGDAETQTHRMQVSQYLSAELPSINAVLQLLHNVFVDCILYMEHGMPDQGCKHTGESAAIHDPHCQHASKAYRCVAMSISAAQYEWFSKGTSYELQSPKPALNELLPTQN